MSVSTAKYSYPNRLANIMLQSMEEIIGYSGLNDVLESANLCSWQKHYPSLDGTKLISFDSVAGLHTSLEAVYGPGVGRGIALRTGRVCFSNLMRTLGPELGLTEPAFRMLPFSAKLDTGLSALADWFNQNSDQHIRIERTAEKISWHIENCPLCWGRRDEVPVCYQAVGMLQEALYWLSSGKFFHVEETRCIACGDPACTIEIDLKALA